MYSARLRSPLLTIFLIVFIDMLGYTIILPVLPFYAEHFGASEFIATTLVSSYAICSFLSTPLLGDLSDRYGRKKLLVFSQIGTAVGFLTIAGAQALWMVFLGRIIDGLTAGNLTIAQATISDHTRPEKRATAFAVIGIAFGLGFTLGPVIAAELARFGIHAPFLAAAALSATSIIATIFLLPEAPRRVAPTEANGPAGRRPGAFDLDVYARYFRHPQAGPLLAQFWAFSFAFSYFIGSLALFLAHTMVTQAGTPWGAREVGWLLAYSGLLGIILQGGILRRLVPRVGEARLVRAGFVAAAMGYAGLMLPLSLGVLLVVTAAGAVGQAFLRPCLTSLLSKAVGPHEQGAALGVSQSLTSMCMIAGPPLGGLMLQQDQLLVWAAIPAVVSLIGFYVARAQVNQAHLTTEQPTRPEHR